VNQRLGDEVWHMITTCWSEDPKERWELSAMRELFSPSPQKVWDPNPDNQTPEAPEARGVLNVETGRRQRKGFLPRITSLFQFLQVPEPEIESRVNGMDQAGFSALPTLLRC